ncbi:MAG: hypothetical protein ABI995_11450 [Acidobacteriota bacterium]
MSRLQMPSGSLAVLVLRVLHSGPLHGFAIAQPIRQLSGEVMEAEGCFGNQSARAPLTLKDRKKQLQKEMDQYREATAAI